MRRDEMHRHQKKGNIWRKAKKDYQIYIFLLPTLLYFIIFCYVPMAGVQIAFKEFSPYLGIWKSPWVGMEQFKRFFDSYQFKSVIVNTLKISLSNLIFGFGESRLCLINTEVCEVGFFYFW